MATKTFKIGNGETITVQTGIKKVTVIHKQYTEVGLKKIEVLDREEITTDEGNSRSLIYSS